MKDLLIVLSLALVFSTLAALFIAVLITGYGCLTNNPRTCNIQLYTGGK
jgi:hypothetical protein